MDFLEFCSDIHAYENRFVFPSLDFPVKILHLRENTSTFFTCGDELPQDVSTLYNIPNVVAVPERFFRKFESASIKQH